MKKKKNFVSPDQNMSKYLFITYISENSGSGQQIRSNLIKESLEKNTKIDFFTSVNLNNWKKRPILTLVKVLIKIKEHNKIIIMLGTRGTRLVSKILSLFKNKNLYYIVIGGNIAFYLSHKNSFQRRLKKYNAIFVQTRHLKEEMKQLQFENIHILSNFKNVNKLDEGELVAWTGKEKIIKVCVLSRVAKNKGIVEAAQAVKLINQELKGKKVILDIFGYINSEFNDEFKKILLSDNINYKGLIHYNTTNIILKEYFALLFPTYWPGEGFPGTILDSMYAGIPIIATNWNSNSELIEHKKNGLIVEVQSPQEIKKALLFLIKSVKTRNLMAHNNFKESYRFTEENVLKEFYNILFK